MLHYSLREPGLIAPVSSMSGSFNEPWLAPKGSPFHGAGCACAGCQTHDDDDGKLFQPGDTPVSTTDVIPGDTSTTYVLTPGSAVNSFIDTAADTDWFSINLVQGETYTFTIYLPPGGLFDSTLALHDSGGTQIAFNDDASFPGGLYWSEITFTATYTGTYYLAVDNYSGETGEYFLSSTQPTNDAIAGDASTTTSITVGGASVQSQLDQTGDRDWIEVTLTAGETYEFTTIATGLGGDADTTLTLRDASGNALAWNDDNAGTYSRVRFEADATGTYYIDVGGWADSSSGNYELTAVVAEPLAEYSNDQIADQLLYGYWGGAPNARRFDVSEGGTLTVDTSALTSDGQYLAWQALYLWGDVLGITFVEGSTDVDITFDDDQEGAFANTSYSGGFIISSSVNVSTDWLSSQGNTLDSYGFQTYLHEIGHALGLGHGGNYNSSANYSQDALYMNDAWSTTVMSYFSQFDNSFFGDQGFSYVFAITPMSADVVAIQNSYGEATTTRTGNTIYGVGNNTGRDVYGVGANVTNNAGNLLAFTIVDHGGTDTLNYSTFSADQLINLNAETFSNVGGSIGNMSIARGTLIENAIAGSGNDELIGNTARNQLTGNGGNDSITGGVNIDTAIFSGNSGSYTITQTSTGVFQVVGPDGTDTLYTIEYAQFDNETIRLLPGTGTLVDFSADPATYMGAIRGFLGTDLGETQDWDLIGQADVNGDGDVDYIYVNSTLGRWATINVEEDGLVYFDDYSWAGETRIVGIYIDPLVANGSVEQGGPFDSQQRFLNDLYIDNIAEVLGFGDYDANGVQEVYFSLTDGTAYLHAYMHADGNIRYANYQNEQQVIDYLTANGYGSDYWGDWFPSDGAPQPSEPKLEDFGIEPAVLASGGWDASPAAFDGQLSSAHIQFEEHFA